MRSGSHALALNANIAIATLIDQEQEREPWLTPQLAHKCDPEFLDFSSGTDWPARKNQNLGVALACIQTFGRCLLSEI